MDAKEEVNHSKRQRRYGAQDKDKLILSIIILHEEGLSQVEIAKVLDISDLRKIFNLLCQHGEIKLDRKYAIFLSLMR